MANLFESAGVVKAICRKSRTGMFREFWTSDLKSSLFEIVSARLTESQQTDELLGTVKDKMSGFLKQVKSRMEQMKATYQEKKVFYSHLVNLIFSELGAGIEGPQLGGPIKQLRTEFPRDYEKGDAKQAALVRRQYETLKNYFAKQNNPDPHQAAIDYIKQNWQGVSDHLLRSLGKEIKPKTPKVISPAAAPVDQEAVAKPEPAPVAPGNPPLGKHKMTMDEIVADAQSHLDSVKKTVHSKDAQKKSVKRYLGEKHFDSPLSRNSIIHVVIDKLFGTDRLEGKSDDHQDEEKAKAYLSVISAAKTAVTGAKKPSVKKVTEGIDDLIQSAAWQNKEFVRLITTPADGDVEGLLALARTRIRHAGYEVGETEKDDLGEGQPEAYKIYFTKPEGDR